MIPRSTPVPTPQHTTSCYAINKALDGPSSSRVASLQNGQYFSKNISLASLPPIKGQDGTSWSRAILQVIFIQWNTLWDTRNKDQHGHDSATQAKKRKDQVLIQLAALYTLRDKVLQRDRSLFHDHLENHQKLPTRSIKQWINMYKPLLLKSIRDAKTKSLLHIRPLTHYFG